MTAISKFVIINVAFGMPLSLLHMPMQKERERSGEVNNDVKGNFEEFEIHVITF